MDAPGALPIAVFSALAYVFLILWLWEELPANGWSRWWILVPGIAFWAIILRRVSRRRNR